LCCIEAIPLPEDNDTVGLTLTDAPEVRHDAMQMPEVDNQIVDKIWADRQAGRVKMSRWRKQALKSFDYVSGKQYEGDEEPDFLYVVLNLIIHRFLTKTGILTAGKPIASVTGRDLDDEEAADVFKDLLEYGADKAHLDTLIQDAVQDAVICGLGVLEEHWTLDLKRWTEQYGFVRGDFQVTREDPLAYTFDPDNRDERLFARGDSGPQWYSKDVWTSRDKLKLAYPNKSMLIQGVNTKKYADEGQEEKRTGGTNADDTMSTGPKRGQDKVLMVEYWYKRFTPINYVVRYFVDKDGNDERMEMVPEMGEVPPEEAWEPGVRYDSILALDEEIWTAACVGDVLLYHRKSPYKHGRWPAVFFCGMMRRDEPVPYGEIERMIVPQDVINANFSLVQDNANRINNPGKIVQPEAFTDDIKNNLPNIMSQPGWTATLKSGFKAQDAYQEIKPQELPTVLLDINKYLQVLLDEIASIAQVQRGGMPYETSGKAIQALLGAGDTALTSIQRNIEYAVTYWGENRISNIQQFMTIEDSLRISDDARQYRVAFEHFTPDGGDQTTLSLVKYEDFEPGQKPEKPKRLLENVAVAQFDLRVTIKSNQDRDPEADREFVLGLFDREIADKQLVLERSGIDGWREVLRRVSEKDEQLKQMQQFQQMMEQSPLLQQMVQNPQVAQQIQQMVAQTAPQLLQPQQPQPQQQVA